MAPSNAARPLAVYDEFGSGQEHGDGSQGHSKRDSGQESPTSGSPAAQAWLTALASHCESAEGAQAKAELVELLHCGARSRSHVVAVQNRVRQQVAVIYSWTHHEGDAADADNPQRARQCQYLFERVLHGLLRATLSQAEADCAAPPLAPAERHAVVEQALEDAELQLGLVNACIEVVNFAHQRSRQEAFPWATMMLGRLHHSLELWQGCDWIADCMEAPLEGAEGSVPGIPEDVVEYLSAIQVRVEEELAFMDNSAIHRRLVATGASIATGAGSLQGDGEGPAGGSKGEGRPLKGGPRFKCRRHGGRSGSDVALVARFLSNMARTAMLRTFSVCQVVLAEFPEVQAACPALGDRVCAVVDLLLCDHLDLLFGQHLSLCIACAIYLTVRLHGETLPFRKITALMVEVLLQHDEATFSHVELAPDDGTGWDGSRQHGDTRAYYNRVFLPVFEQYDAAQLFGQDVAATPAKQQLQAPEPRAAARGGADVTSAGGKQAKPGREQGAGSAGVVVKEHRRLRHPLGQVSTNSNSGKAAAGGAALTPLR